MFDAELEIVESNRVTHYRLRHNGVALTYSETLELWQTDADFRNYFTQLLADSPFSAYRWETPALSILTAGRPFEFVLINSPRYASRTTDQSTYQAYFTSDDTDEGIVAFNSLGGDATLVVPSPRTATSAYGHLAAFIRNAPDSQVQALWRVVASTVKAKLSAVPIWLNTAGGGVAWLHVRLDSRPKYYDYLPYKS